jgi:lipoprotein-anchoring transpeptidase ErfK/SrfK
MKAINISKGGRRLVLTNFGLVAAFFPIAIGKPSTPTPNGDFAINSKILSPGGILGSRWLGLTAPSYGIHGTNAPYLIGQMVSNGCIRMFNHDVEALFELVEVGTPVFIRE